MKYIKIIKNLKEELGARTKYLYGNLDINKIASSFNDIEGFCIIEYNGEIPEMAKENIEEMSVKDYLKKINEINNRDEKEIQKTVSLQERVEKLEKQNAELLKLIAEKDIKANVKQ